MVQQPDHNCPADKSELSFRFYIHLMNLIQKLTLTCRRDNYGQVAEQDLCDQFHPHVHVVLNLQQAYDI